MKIKGDHNACGKQNLSKQNWFKLQRSLSRERFISVGNNEQLCRKSDEVKILRKTSQT